MSVRQATGPVPPPKVVAELIERSDERDLYLQRILAAWREGYHAAELAYADDYQRGLYDGAMARKRAEHDLVDMVRLQVARYGPDARPVTDPRPEDFPGMLRDYPRQDGAA
jgi:hypothetical protein